MSGEREELGDTKFDTNVSNEMLHNTAKCQGYRVAAFAAYELLRENKRRSFKFSYQSKLPPNNATPIRKITTF